MPEARTRLRDIYLAAWTIYEPMERLVEAFELAQSLGALHQAISYRNIVASVEEVSRQELDGAPYWLRRVLSSMPGDE